MKTLNVINLRTVSDVLSDTELKNVLGGYGDGLGRCGWKRATVAPCLIDWDGDCTTSCAYFLAMTCPQSAEESWCVE